MASLKGRQDSIGRYRLEAGGPSPPDLQRRARSGNSDGTLTSVLQRQERFSWNAGPVHPA